MDKVDWKTGDAKQRFSEVLRRAEDEPQAIYRRDRLVAAVISAKDFARFRHWQERSKARSLGDAASEIREICAEYGYELDVGAREDRQAWADETS